MGVLVGPPPPVSPVETCVARLGPARRVSHLLGLWRRAKGDTDWGEFSEEQAVEPGWSPVECSRIANTGSLKTHAGQCRVRDLGGHPVWRLTSEVKPGMACRWHRGGSSPPRSAAALGGGPRPARR